MSRDYPFYQNLTPLEKAQLLAEQYALLIRVAGEVEEIESDYPAEQEDIIEKLHETMEQLSGWAMYELGKKYGT